MAAAALTAAAAGASLIGSAVSAGGDISAGQSQQEAYDTNAAIQRQNAQIATAQAQSQSDIDRVTTERRLGTIRADYGAGGVDPTQGSPLEVMADQASTGFLTRQLALYRGKVAATGDIEQAGILTQEGAAAAQAGRTKAIGTILTGLGSTARSVSTLFPQPSAAQVVPPVSY